MTLQIEGQISIFEIMPYLKEPKKEVVLHNCPFYMWVKNGVSYTKKKCDIDWSKCGQCCISKDFYSERDRLMEMGVPLVDAIDESKEKIYAKYGAGNELLPAE